MPSALLAFDWTRRLRDEIQRSVPEAVWMHEPEGKAPEAVLAGGDACYPFKRMVSIAAALGPLVDILLVPRLLRLDGHLMCPNFRALPDIVSLNIDRSSPVAVVDTVVDIADSRGETAAFSEIVRAVEGRRNSFPAGPQADHAGIPGAEEGRYREGLGSQSEERLQTGPRIALIGHPYLLADPHLNKGIPAMLRSRGCSILTPADVPFAELDRLAAADDYYAKKLYWRAARECLGAFRYFTGVRRVSGIIYMVAFNCGVDALMRIELMSLYQRMEQPVPFMVLIGDEHTQREHLLTRIEAFLDIVHGVTLD
jgi:predicted nucleotide-binding protein (sugar kinase/HSP70/actin superfamily)